MGYADDGFAGFAKYKGSEFLKMLADMNLTCQSSHFDINELRKDLPGRIAWANDMGLKQMIVPSLDGPKHPRLDDVKRAADEYNKMAEESAKAGLQQGLHNEDFELTTVDGKRTYDLLFDLLDPKLVKFQFQVSTISQGYDAAQYFMKYPGRFFSMHVQGWSARTRKSEASAREGRQAGGCGAEIGSMIGKHPDHVGMALLRRPHCRSGAAQIVFGVRLCAVRAAASMDLALHRRR